MRNENAQFFSTIFWLVAVISDIFKASHAKKSWSIGPRLHFKFGVSQASGWVGSKKHCLLRQNPLAPGVIIFENNLNVLGRPFLSQRNLKHIPPCGLKNIYDVLLNEFSNWLDGEMFKNINIFKIYPPGVVIIVVICKKFLAHLLTNNSSCWFRCASHMALFFRRQIMSSSFSWGIKKVSSWIWYMDQTLRYRKYMFPDIISPCFFCSRQLYMRFFSRFLNWLGTGREFVHGFKVTVDTSCLRWQTQPGGDGVRWQAPPGAPSLDILHTKRFQPSMYVFQNAFQKSPPPLSSHAIFKTRYLMNYMERHGFFSLSSNCFKEPDLWNAHFTTQNLTKKSFNFSKYVALFIIH